MAGSRKTLSIFRFHFDYGGFGASKRKKPRSKIGALVPRRGVEFRPAILHFRVALAFNNLCYYVVERTACLGCCFGHCFDHRFRQLKVQNLGEWLSFVTHQNTPSFKT
jgi:hypothetical protein